MQIPSVDLLDFTSKSPSDKSRFIQKLGQAYHEIGFVAVSNHGLSIDTQEQLYSTIKSFFDLSDEEKKEFYRPESNGQRGYVPKKIEQAQGASVADLKEFYHVGQVNNTGEYPDNVWPKTNGFKEAQEETFKTLENTGAVLLRAIAIFLGLEEDYFDKKVIGGNSILRSIHYYPLVGESVEKGAVRAAAHGDINLITLLMGASAEGLEIKTNSDDWIPVTALENHIIVNVGDMLSRLTNNYLKSTIHRVVNPRTEAVATARFSVPFFMHPKASMDLSCLPSCINENNPKLYSDITAGDFLLERLREIGLA